MKQVSADMATFLSGENLTMCRLLQITRTATDGAVFSFTDLDTDIVYGGNVVANVPWGTIIPSCVAAGGGNTAIQLIPAASILVNAPSWTISIQSTNAVQIQNCAVARTLPGSLDVIDFTPITFGGVVDFITTPGTMTSDVIALPIDNAHDYWFMIYGPFPGTGDWYIDGSEGDNPLALNTQSSFRPNSGTDLIGTSPLGFPWESLSEEFWIKSFLNPNALALATYVAGDVGGDGNSADSGAGGGITVSAVEIKADGSPNNVTVTGFLSDSGINENDINAHLYDGATFELRAVNWQDLTMGDLKLLSGTVGDITAKNGQYTMELRGWTQRLALQQGDLYGPNCRAELFGGGAEGIDPTNHWKCRLNRADWVQNGVVGSSPDLITIVPTQAGSPPATALMQIGPPYSGEDTAPAGWFAQGVITFTSGALNGYFFDIASWDGAVLQVFAAVPMPYSPAPGDTFEIEPGCDKTAPTCQSKFVNIVNFQGEANIPGLNVIGAVSRQQVPN